jgi:hypothetical protein
MAWTQVRCFAAGELRPIPVKVIGPLYWRKAGVDRPLLLVVIKPLGYRSRTGGKLQYRQPAFLICTDPTLSLELLVQAYVYRWEIECNHRDEKSLLGVGQGQVRNPEAVRRLPQLQVAGYSPAIAGCCWHPCSAPVFSGTKTCICRCPNGEVQPPPTGLPC